MGPPLLRLQSRLPERLQRLPYGYAIVFACTVSFVCSGPGQTNTLGSTIAAVVTEFNFPRTKVSLLYLVATLGSACTLPILGRVADSYGPRKLFIAMSLGLAGSCWLYAKTSGLWTLLGAFYLLRATGQGGRIMMSSRGRKIFRCGQDSVSWSLALALLKSKCDEVDHVHNNPRARVVSAREFHHDCCVFFQNLCTPFVHDIPFCSSSLYYVSQQASGSPPPPS